MRGIAPRACPRAVPTALLAVCLLATACGGHRILRGIFGEHGTFLVRHTHSGPLEIWAGDERLGVADSAEVMCWEDVPTGSFRARAVVVGDTVTVRATNVVLTPDDPLLWDVDHDQVVPGRVHARYCEG